MVRVDVYCIVKKNTSQYAGIRKRPFNVINYDIVLILKTEIFDSLFRQTSFSILPQHRTSFYTTYYFAPSLKQTSRYKYKRIQTYAYFSNRSARIAKNPLINSPTRRNFVSDFIDDVIKTIISMINGPTNRSCNL